MAVILPVLLVRALLTGEATISGTVTDPSGAPVAAASVVLRTAEQITF
jgi:hypothetical protein